MLKIFLIKSNTVMRIASICKSMTMAVVCKLLQEGSFSLEKLFKDYVKKFPDIFLVKK